MNRSALWLTSGLSAGLLGGLLLGRAFAPVPEVAVPPAGEVPAVAEAPAPVAAVTAPPLAAAEPVTPTAIPPNTQLPTARSGLRLLGTITGRPEDRIALIEKVATGAQHIYILGDTIQPGVTLARIDANSVVLDRGGQWEVLKLTTTESAPPAGSATIELLSTPGARAPHRVYNEMTHVGPASDAHSTRPRKTRRDEHHTLVPATFQRQHGMTLATAILSAGVESLSIDGEPAGLRLRDLGSSSVLRGLGFREGDVLLSATGIPLDRRADLAILAEDFEGGRQMWVRIERAGAARYLLYRFS